MKVLILNLFIIVMVGHAACTDCEDISLGNDCPRDQRVENMAEFKDMILHLHNTLRNKLAGGYIRRLKPATRMLTMKWDDELSKKAERNVLQCRVHIDECHATAQFPYAGQNSGVAYGRVMPASHFKDIIENWWETNELVSDAALHKYPAMDEAPFSNFTIMAKGINTHVGCAAAINWGSLWTKNYFLTCNYAIGNAVGQSTYKMGESASQCKTGRNKEYKNLCSPDETLH